MSSFDLPDAVAIAAMSPAEREAFLRRLDRQRRLAEAQVATFLHAVGEVGAHLEDGHRSLRAWGQSSCNWSHTEANRLVKTGRLLDTYDAAAELAETGELGVAQLHALASVVTNPRVQPHLAEGETRSWVRRCRWTTRIC